MTDLEFGPVAFGLLSAATWGAGDFSGGLACKRAGVFGVIIASQAIGMLLLIGLALAFDTAVPEPSDLVWGAGAGLAGAVGLSALYRGLAAGRMGLVAPLSALLAATLPVVVGAITQGLPDGAKRVGFGLALTGVWLLSRPPDPFSFRVNEILLPVAAGLGFGLFFVLMDRASDHAIFWPIVAARVALLGSMGTVARLTRQPIWPAAEHWRLILLAGVLDAGGNAFFNFATQAGRLDVASVLSSLYPASTVALARVVLKERLTRSQWIGVAAALGAIVFIAL